MSVKSYNLEMFFNKKSEYFYHHMEVWYVIEVKLLGISRVIAPKLIENP